MGRKLSTAAKEFTPEPIVNVRGEKGQYFEGLLLEHRTIKGKYKNEDGSDKPQHIFSFAIEDTDMSLELKQPDGTYAEAKVNVGDTVSIFPPTRLFNALNTAQKGEKIRIVYTGLGKAGKFGGKPHTFNVEVI